MTIQMKQMYEVDAGELGVKRIHAASLRDAMEKVFLPTRMSIAATGTRSTGMTPYTQPSGA